MLLSDRYPMRSRYVILATFFVLLASSELSRAQTPADQAARQARSIVRVQAAEEQERRNRDLTQRADAPDRQIATPDDLPGSRPGETCIQVDEINPVGITLLPPTIVETTISKWEGECIGLAEINQVLQAITYLYIQRGYIASRAYIAEQDLSDGVLEIAVIEGTFKEFRSAEASRFGRSELASAFPGLVGKPVNLRDIEQGLDQINRLASNDATTTLEAGSEPGESIIVVANQPGRRWHASVGADNLGSEATGIYRSNANLTMDNLFGINDEWRLGYRRSMDEHSLHFTDEVPNSNAVNASVSIPYGYWTGGLDVNWSNYHSSLSGTVSEIDTSGGSISISPYLSRVLHRDQISKTLLTGRLTWKQNENFILGNRIDVSSRRLAIATAELAHSRQLLNGQAIVALGYDQGLAILGAFDDSEAPDGSAKGQFSRITLSASYLRPLELNDRMSALYSGHVQGQWSPHSLFSSEQFSLGGYSTVRGTRESLLYGNVGILMRNELSLRLPVAQHAAFARSFGRFEPYVAIDTGYIVPDSSGNSVEGGLVGGTLGLRNRGGRINFDVSYSDILLMPNDVEAEGAAETGLFQARLSVSF